MCTTTRVVETYWMYAQPTMEAIERRRQSGWALLNVRNVKGRAQLQYIWAAPVESRGN